MNPAEPAIGIAIVEDNDTLRELLVSYLSRPGWEVIGADCGEALDQLMKTTPLHIVVLDLSLPHEDGFSIARRLKQAFPDIRIIMLTARTRPLDRTNAYNQGVDVFLTKPTNARELEAIIKNLTPLPPQDLPLSYTLIRGVPLLRKSSGEHVTLSHREAFLLEQLSLAPLGSLETEQILEKFREGGLDDINRETLTVTTSRLRKKLEEAAIHDAAIVSIRGFGYRIEIPLTLQ